MGTEAAPSQVSCATTWTEVKSPVATGGRGRRSLWGRFLLKEGIPLGECSAG